MRPEHGGARGAAGTVLDGDRRDQCWGKWELPKGDACVLSMPPLHVCVLCVWQLHEQPETRVSALGRLAVTALGCSHGPVRGVDKRPHV